MSPRLLGFPLNDSFFFGTVQMSPLLFFLRVCRRVQKREAIEPMMKVIEQVCELIDTTDDVFSFKVQCTCPCVLGLASYLCGV